MNEHQQQQEQRQNSRSNAVQTPATHPSSSSDAHLFHSIQPTDSTHASTSPVTTNALPSHRIVEAAALHNGNEPVTAMSAHPVTDSSQVSTGDMSASTDTPSACGSSCWMVLGPVVAGVVVAAMIFGLVMARRRRRMRSNSEPSLKHKEKNKGDVLDDDDLMVEMFEPPELLTSGNISSSFFNWRNASSFVPQQQQQENDGTNRRGSAQLSGRSTMLGLTTILEEGSNHEQQRIKKYHGNIRRASNKGSGGNLSPLRVASPNLLRGPLPLPGTRSNLLLAGETPPLSPLISPSPSPALSDATGGGGGSGLPTAPGQAYLSAPSGRPKRKLTIPYTPQDVTRRRSLEGSW